MKEHGNQDSVHLSGTSKTELTRNNKASSFAEVSHTPNTAALHIVQGLRVAECDPSYVQ